MKNFEQDMNEQNIRTSPLKPYFRILTHSFDGVDGKETTQTTIPNDIAVTLNSGSS
jgi:hypothetical protein